MDRYRPLSLKDLNEVLPRLQATIDLLTQTFPGGSEHKPVASKVAARKNGVAGAPELRAQIRAYLAKSGGASVPQIAKALGSDVEAVRYGLHVLRKEKVVQMSGTRMKAQWHLGKNGS